MAKRNTNPPIAAGQQFVRLTAVRFIKQDRPGTPRWEFQCACGNIITARISNVKSGAIASCGCLRKELTSARRTTHGMRQSREYISWARMLQRCQNPRSTGWEEYGGRGISISERWMKFEDFFEDMGPMPGPNYSIDRIDVNGNYEPGNCRWATAIDQARNRRNSIIVEYDGEKMHLIDACKMIGISYSTVQTRLNRGWSMKDALSPLRRKRT